MAHIFIISRMILRLKNLEATRDSLLEAMVHRAYDLQYLGPPLRRGFPRKLAAVTRYIGKHSC